MYSSFIKEELEEDWSLSKQYLKKNYRYWMDSWSREKIGFFCAYKAKVGRSLIGQFIRSSRFFKAKPPVPKEHSDPQTRALHDVALLVLLLPAPIRFLTIATQPCRVCDTLASNMAMYVCASTHSSEQSDHSHHTIIVTLNICLLPCCRASTLFYRVRDVPVCSNVKNALVHNYILYSLESNY